jgi:hypothetical protein
VAINRGILTNYFPAKRLVPLVFLAELPMGPNAATGILGGMIGRWPPERGWGLAAMRRLLASLVLDEPPTGP